MTYGLFLLPSMILSMIEIYLLGSSSSCYFASFRIQLTWLTVFRGQKEQIDEPVIFSLLLGGPAMTSTTRCQNREVSRASDCSCGAISLKNHTVIIERELEIGCVFIWICGLHEKERLNEVAFAIATYAWHSRYRVPTAC